MRHRVIVAALGLLAGCGGAPTEPDAPTAAAVAFTPAARLHGDWELELSSVEQRRIAALRAALAGETPDPAADDADLVAWVQQTAQSRPDHPDLRDLRAFLARVDAHTLHVDDGSLEVRGADGVHAAVWTASDPGTDDRDRPTLTLQMRDLTGGVRTAGVTILSPDRIAWVPRDGEGATLRYRRRAPATP